MMDLEKSTEKLVSTQAVDADEFQPIQPLSWNDFKIRASNIRHVFGTPDGDGGNLHIQVGTFLLLYAAVQHFCDLDALWSRIADKYFDDSNDQFLLMVVGGFSVTSLAYWVAAAVYTALEFWPGASQYKLQPERKTSWQDIKSAAVNVLRNQLVVNLPLTILYWLVMTRVDWSLSQPFPTVWRLILNILVIATVDEVLLYFFHRLCHTQQFWRFHKIHHQFKSPTGTAAVSAHPVEHLLVNTLPMLVGPMIMRSHFALVIIWICAAQIAAIHAHCGHKYPSMDTPALHDMHHRVGYCNYGPFGVLDRLFGTYKQPTPLTELNNIK
ncbi:hypothetical protein MIR68_004395 [Amoeboaphelidium protococcarum]|nr:hypothetical protein MIR68_004395 [Amoeboaphelidium protococcarum]